MPTDPAVFVSSVICESVLRETTGVSSAVRIMSAIKLNPIQTHVHFFVLTSFHQPNYGVPDLHFHEAVIQMVGNRAGGWEIVASAKPYSFVYTRKDEAIGGMELATEFTVDLSKLPDLGTYFMQVLLDGQLVAQAPLSLLR